MQNIHLSKGELFKCIGHRFTVQLVTVQDGLHSWHHFQFSTFFGPLLYVA